MSRQMPELYLRGAIFNETMKNLTPQQMEEVEEKIEVLLKTPSLTKSREKFCHTLANTIGADYREDKNAAMQEYILALLRAVLYILFYKPNRQVFDDPVQTRKLVSQITYNYMKQILNENKIPKSVREKHVEGDPYMVAKEEIINILKKDGVECKQKHHRSEDGYIIEGDIGVISLKTATRIGKLKAKYAKIGVSINADLDRIEILKEWSAPIAKVKIRSTDRIKVVHFENEPNEENEDKKGGRDSLEYRISSLNKEPESKFDPATMRKILPEHLVGVFDIITQNEKESTKNEIANKLQISSNEVSRRLKQMKYYYYAAVD